VLFRRIANNSTISLTGYNSGDIALKSYVLSNWGRRRVVEERITVNIGDNGAGMGLED